MTNSGMGKMHLDLYTQNAGLTQKAKFWCNYVSALKVGGREGLLVKEHVDVRKLRKPSKWALYRPQDITLFDLIYEDEIYYPPSLLEDYNQQYNAITTELLKK